MDGHERVEFDTVVVIVDSVILGEQINGRGEVDKHESSKLDGR